MSEHDPQHLIPAAQYLRASSEHQRYSVPSQKAAIALYALERGFNLVRSYVDDGRSGVTITKRTGLKQLLADVLAGDAPFATVLVLDVSRWGRFENPDQAAHYEFICREAGVRVRYCAEAFEDDDSMTSALMKGIKRVMAAEYSRQLSDRCRAGMWRRRQTGGKGGGPPPFGFMRQVFNEDGSPGPVLADGDRRARLAQTVKLVPGPPDDVALARRIFRMFVTDMRGIAEIVRILNDEGAFRRGAPWTYTSIKYLLTNEIALGIQAFGRTVWRFGKIMQVRERAEWTRVKVSRPIVPRALFAAAQSKLASLHGRRWTDDEMLEKLRRLRQLHGYLSRRLIDGEDGMPRAPAYADRFGSLTEAYRRIGHEWVRRTGEHVDAEGLEPDEIVRRMKRLLSEKGYLSSRAIHRCGYLPSVKTIKVRFGSLRAVYLAAGYDLTLSEMLVAAHARRRARNAELGRLSLKSSP